MTTEKTDAQPRPAMPFVIYENQLELMSRLVASSCRLATSVLESSKTTQSQVSAALAQQEEGAKTMAAAIIPSTGDVEAATKTVTSAMNEAATRALAAQSGSADDKPDSPAPAAGTAQSSRKTAATPATKSR